MFFFFFKQKTAYEMRISDWSSDVCSSDLFLAAHVAADRGLALVAGDDLHLGRLADHAHGRAHRLAREELQEVWHALAADLLVVGEAEMDRCREIVLEEARRMGQRPRDEGLHNRGAAAVEAAAVPAHPHTGRASCGERVVTKGLISVAA